MFWRSRPPVVVITDPCEEDWQTMPIGPDGQRYCDRCAKTVHNLADMTSKEVRKLFADSNGRVCTRVLYDDAGGLVVRQDSSRFSSGLIPVTVLSVAAVAVPAASSAQALSAPSCHIQVDVHDLTGAPIPNSSARFNEGGLAGDVILEGSAGAEGIITGELKPGRYGLSVQSVGFAASTETVDVQCSDAIPYKRSVQLQVGQTGGAAICKRPNVFKRSWTKLLSRNQTAQSTN